MLGWVILLGAAALIAGVLGFFALAGVLAFVVQLLFLFFLALLVMTLISRAMARDGRAEHYRRVRS